MKLLTLKLIRLYQKTLSPDHGLVSLLHPWPGVCKFRPTCSEYAYQSIEKYGLMKGIFNSLKRLFRCHPWSQGGWDPPEIK
ncbi:membrane protein insertion efficiency factor YidD [Patescibacteria group bacterium]|nr:membrane protein insertion efficiency factor YidD [Patescibacteria group bacterium]